MNFLKALLLPPVGLIVLATIALMLRRRIPRTAPRILAGCVIALYIVSTPLFSTWALGSLQPAYFDPVTRKDAQAIVLLGGGTTSQAPEYGADTVNFLSLIRLRYAAKLHRDTGLPILASGGSVSGETIAEADQMAAVLTQEMSVPVRWRETHSVDTFTNALETAKILKAAGIDRVLLVTHAWHMPRARLAFEHAGLEAIPAPTGFVRPEAPELSDLMPRASGIP